MKASSGDIDARTYLPKEKTSTSSGAAQEALEDEHEIPGIDVGNEGADS
jgi:hypothetical protein